MERIFGSGGMPSSHSSTVCAAATVVCRLYGPDSAIFGVMVIMSVIVMYDAMNVRYHAGVQAKELNIIRKELKNNKVLNEDFNNKISGNELKELLGHTPLEVLCGSCSGNSDRYNCPCITDMNNNTEINNVALNALDLPED